MEPSASLTNENDETITVEDLCLLANSFTEQAQFDKAIQLYESACKLFPNNLALKINLGRVRNLKNQSFDSPSDILPKKKLNQEQVEQWANWYQGLGEILANSGRINEAKRIFEISKVNHRNFFLPYLNLGRLHVRTKDYNAAVRELEQARRLNPFNIEVLSLLFQAHFQERDFKEALICAVDAFVLSGEGLKKKPGLYGSQIKKAMSKVTGFTRKMRNDLIRERRNRINALYEELEVTTNMEEFPASQKIDTKKRESTPVKLKDLHPQSEAVEEEDEKKLYDLAAQMKKHLIFRNMEDQDVLKIAKFTSELRVLQADYVYQEGDPIYGLYFVNRGKVEIQKATPFGPIIYAAFEKGSFFGDDNLLSGRERFTSAIAVQESDFLFLDKAGLANIFARERAMAIHFLWYFWKSLSLQIRESNDRMTSFFAATSEQVKKEIFAKEATRGGVPTHIEIDKKLEVLQTKGLSSKELGHVARLSNEEVYNQGEAIFKEGDIGDRLYIVLEGSVLISKSIPGVGEEALAVLRKGDFFGEMALVGQSHTRSADAHAQDQGTTLLVISREVLREILSIDTNSAYQFLTILCRILSQRLLEMNEKIYQWRLMSGSFSS